MSPLMQTMYTTSARLRSDEAGGNPQISRLAPREGQTNSHRGGDLYLDELRFDSPKLLIPRAKLRKELY